MPTAQRTIPPGPSVAPAWSSRSRIGCSVAGSAPTRGNTPTADRSTGPPPRCPHATDRAGDAPRRAAKAGVIRDEGRPSPRSGRGACPHSATLHRLRVPSRSSPGPLCSAVQSPGRRDPTDRVPREVRIGAPPRSPAVRDRDGAVGGARLQGRCAYPTPGNRRREGSPSGCPSSSRRWLSVLRDAKRLRFQA